MRWPSTFIPDEDDGYFIAVVQLPPAASLERTQAVGDKINAILDSYPEVENYIGPRRRSDQGRNPAEL